MKTHLKVKLGIAGKVSVLGGEYKKLVFHNTHTRTFLTSETMQMIQDAFDHRCMVTTYPLTDGLTLAANQVLGITPNEIEIIKAEKEPEKETYPPGVRPPVN